MTSYRKTMGEAYRSMYIVEDNMDLMRKAAKGAMQTIKFKDGKLKMDSFTASAIMGVHAKVNPKNRASMENMINSGTKAQILKLQSLAMKSIKSENDPTVDEHKGKKKHKHPHLMTKDGEEVKEGTWQMPQGNQGMKGLKRLLSKPLELGKEGDKATDAIGQFIGDDELFDALYAAGKKDPKGDAIPIIKKAMKRLNIREETLDEDHHKPGAKIKVPHKGKMVQGKVVRFDKGGPASPFYVVDVGERESIKVPEHKLKEELDLDEARGMTAHVIVMRHKDNKNLSVSVVANTKNVNAKKKEGYVIDKALLAPNSATVSFAKEIQRVIRDGDKNPKTGGYKEEVSEDYVITVKGKEVSKHKEEKDARSEFSNLRKKHGNDVKITKEELDLDEAKGVVQPTKDGKGVFKVLPRDTKGMSGKQDPFSMGVYDKSGKKLIKDLGSHPSLEGAKKFARNHGIIEGLLDEAKYDIYHKTFSAAMQHAYAAAKKIYGITVDPSEIDKNVATGPKKPSSGKTNKYRLKGDKGSIQVQVANLDNKKYELNMYKEELEEARQLKDKKKEMMVKSKTSGVIVIDKTDFDKYKKKGYFAVEETQAEGFPNGDGGDIPAMEVGTDRYRDYAKTLTPGESVEEGSAGADARRQISRDKDLGKNKDSADDDDDASDDDVKAASKNIIMQMRKVISLRGNFKVEFGNGKKEKLDPKIAQAVISKYNSAKRPAEKEKFQKQIAKSKKDLLGSLKESLQEGKMKELHGYIQQGKSAKEISKLMKVDVNTIKKLMSSYSVSERTLFRINSKIKERKNG